MRYQIGDNIQRSLTCFVEIYLEITTRKSVLGAIIIIIGLCPLYLSMEYVTCTGWEVFREILVTL